MSGAESATLLLRLAGPMQAWGTQSRFSMRDTEREPSKSGVIGLLCAALGRPREAPVADLAALAMGVRVDREGTLARDFQTAGGHHGQRERDYGVPDPSGKAPRTVLSNRYYLADADFLVGLAGERALLEELDAALRRPRWQLSLGRKAFVPGAPLRLPDEPPWGPGLRALPLETALRGYPWLGAGQRRWRAEPPQRLRLVLEGEAGVDAEARLDVPLSFAERRFGLRYVRTLLIPFDQVPNAGGALP